MDEHPLMTGDFVAFDVEILKHFVVVVVVVVFCFW